MQEPANPYTVFLRSVRLSGLIDPEFLKKFVEEYENSSPADLSPDMRLGGLITRFLGESILTPWQCGKLMLGRHKGFIFGDYLLRDYLGVHKDRKDAEAYLARDLREKAMDVVLEFEHLREDLRSGREPQFSVTYQRRLTSEPV